MSIQTDCEMLFVEATEMYSEEKGISANEAAEIFHQHQVYERMMLQHEYLHQVSTEEMMEYVETIIKDSTKELTVYHGSSAEFDKIDLEKSHNRRDFGKGFYTTLLETQSKEWGYRLALREKKKSYYVYEFLFEEDPSLKVKRFDTLNEEWLEFIRANRSKGGVQHSYDVVIGPVADDNTMETVQLYMSGIYNAKEAVERLQYNKVNNQISFHTKRALKYLHFVRRNDYGHNLYV